MAPIPKSEDREDKEDAAAIPIHPPLIFPNIFHPKECQVIFRYPPVVQRRASSTMACG